MIQIGKIVFFKYPIPKWRMDPSLLYKKSGLPIWITTNINKNNKIDTIKGFSLTNGFI